MNKIEVTVTEAARHFSDYVNRVAYKGEHFILVKGKKVVAEICPAPRGRVLGELNDLLSKLPLLSVEEAETFFQDLEKSREQLANEKMRDPWAS